MIRWVVVSQLAPLSHDTLADIRARAQEVMDGARIMWLDNTEVWRNENTEGGGCLC